MAGTILANNKYGWWTAWQVFFGLNGLARISSLAGIFETVTTPFFTLLNFNFKTCKLMIKKMAPKRKATQEITIEIKEIIASAHGAKHLVDPS